MVAIVSVLVILALSILVTRIATVALTNTGLSREAAAFQARSAFTGVGFTTSEAEAAVSHPVRRRIVSTLMLLGNVGIVTGISSLILGFVDTGGEGAGGWLRLLILVLGVAALIALARSRLVDRWLSRVIGWALDRWSRVEARDYEALLHLSSDYRVREMDVDPGEWLAGCTLGELRLRSEGVNVLGVEKADGSYIGAPGGDTRLEAGDTILVYGHTEGLEELSRRSAGPPGDAAHRKAVIEQERRRESERREQEDRGGGEARR